MRIRNGEAPQTIRVLRQPTFWSLDEFGVNYRRPDHQFREPQDQPHQVRYLDGEMRQRLTKAINDLPERERLIMTLYYYEEVSMKEIGLIIGVVESRISQLHASAVLHLRARLAPRNDRRTPTATPGHKGTPAIK